MSEIDDRELEAEVRALEKAERQPWDRLPNEPAEEYDLFLRFLLQGPGRKVTKAARMEGVTKHVGTLYRYSRKWRWKERAAYWDRDRSRRLDDAMFWHEYDARIRNLEKLDAAVDKLVGNIQAAHIESMPQAMARRRLGQNTTLLSRFMEMEERLMRLGRREFCPYCRMRLNERAGIDEDRARAER